MEVIKVLVAVAMGLLSGFQIYMTAGILFADREPSVWFVLLFFLGGVAVSIGLLLRGATKVAKVFARGFLLGAAEWLALIPVGFIYSAKQLSGTITSGTSGGTEATGAVLGAGLVSFLTGGVAIAMTVVCLIGFTVAYFISREMTPDEGATKKCRFCAETIKQEAQVCRYCGRELEVHNAAA
jgi:hypothetical protein